MPDAHATESPPRRRGRPTGDHAAQRRAIARTAYAVIADDGYERASMRRIAASAGCSTGQLSHYFSTRSAIIIAVIDGLNDIVEAQVRATRAAKDIPTALRNMLQDAMTNRAEARRAWYVWLQLLAAGQNDADVAAELSERYLQMRKLLTAVMRAGQRHGQLRSDRAPSVLADQFRTTLDGLVMMSAVDTRAAATRSLKALVDATIADLSHQHPGGGP